MRRKFLYRGLAAALLFNIVSFVVRHHWQPAKGYAVRVAPDTCSCYSSARIIHLHLAKDGSLKIGSEAIQATELASSLSEIYSVRAERILYLSADSDVAFQRVAEVVDVTQNLEFPQSYPEPLALKHGRSMRVQLRLITKSSIDATCAAECFNWIKQPFVFPRGSP